MWNANFGASSISVIASRGPVDVVCSMCRGSPMLSLAWKGLNHGPALTLGLIL
jgi:hypothetical protein